jgi:carbamoyltransferase
MQEIMNLKIKFRESFRPFAPLVLEERVSEYFDHQGSSPYMQVVVPVAESVRRHLSDQELNRQGLDRRHVARSSIPAVTHVDNSARIQTVSKSVHPLLYRLLKAFEMKTGCGVLINTSFNVRGEPIVCTVEDAWRCFQRTNMDYLVMGNFLLEKKEQKPLDKDADWLKEFELD